MSEKQIIIFGSSRSFGNTRAAINQVLGKTSVDIVDLNNFNISPFDYEHKNAGDDFIPLIEKIIGYDTFVIATPVYWYSMSTQHKIFFDRFSDLLKIRKDLGRRLRGKNLFVVASFHSSYPKGFEVLFEQMCDYLGMNYWGTSFVYSGEEDTAFLENNMHHIAKARSTLNYTS